MTLVLDGLISFDCEEIELSIQPQKLFSLIESIVERSQVMSVKFCLFFVGGNLKENLITQLKHCFYKCKKLKDYISEISFNSHPNSTLFAGIEYANSLACIEVLHRRIGSKYPHRPKGLRIPSIYIKSDSECTSWHKRLFRKE